MRCMLLMYRDEKWWDAKPEEERSAIRQQAVDVSEALRKRGIYLAGDPLLPTSTATTVRLRDGRRSPRTGRSPRPRSSWAATPSWRWGVSTRRSRSPWSTP